MLCILQIVAEYFGMVLDNKASEMTVYKKFAMILDFVFLDLDMTMQDEETVSEAMKQNNHDAPNYFGKKIDLLLKTKDGNVELARNEWKSTKMKHLLLRQQSKNIRSNCAILNKLYVTSRGKVNKIMAADIVGNYGYLYVLELKKNIYVASLFQTISFHPTSPNFNHFKDTIKALFIWRDYLADLITNGPGISAEQPRQHCTHLEPFPTIGSASNNLLYTENQPWSKEACTISRLIPPSTHVISSLPHHRHFIVLLLSLLSSLLLSSLLLSLLLLLLV
ncbi:unnamed protein product [Absidia cylindrospora]